MYDGSLVASNPAEFGPEAVVERCARAMAALLGEALS
jgi:hypothetical protein